MKETDGKKAIIEKLMKEEKTYKQRVTTSALKMDTE